VFKNLLTAALLAAPFTAFAGQTSSEHVSVGVTAGVLPAAGVGVAFASDRFHVAADVGVGGIPFVVSEPWARVGGNVAFFGGERNQLRLQPMVGWQRVQLQALPVMVLTVAGSDDADAPVDLVSGTLAVEGVHWMNSHAGLYGRVTTGVAANRDDVLPIAAASVGVMF
jgi:hypothetical protein